MDGMGGMAGAPPPHDHLAHAPHDKMHAAVERLPDGSYRYPHGAFLGHVVPGSFFMVSRAARLMLLTAHTCRA